MATHDHPTPTGPSKPLPDDVHALTMSSDLRLAAEAFFVFEDFSQVTPGEEARLHTATAAIVAAGVEGVRAFLVRLTEYDRGREFRWEAAVGRAQLALGLAAQRSDAAREVLEQRAEADPWILVPALAYSGAAGVDALRRLCRHESSSVRLHAVDALATIGQAAQSAVPDIEHVLLRDRDEAADYVFPALRRIGC